MASKKKGVHRFGDFLNKDNDEEDEHSGQGGGGGSGGAGGGPKGPKKDYVGNGQEVVNPKNAKEARDAVLAMKGVEGGGEGKDLLELKMWKNGYQVGEDDLCSYETPEGLAFMGHIMQGRVPPSVMTPERQKLMREGNMEVKIVDKRGEEFKAPTVRVFKGESHTLASTTPVVTSAVVKDGDAAPAPPVDDSAPSTTVQVKLVDGRRVPIKINLSRTVRDLQCAVAALRATAGKSFVLKAGFPPKTLDNPAATIGAAGLQAAAITQSLA